MKIKTCLPLFSGFYNTLWCPDEYISEIELEDEVEYELDFNSYAKDVIGLISDKISDKLKENGIECRISIEKINSPKEYNYSNDSADVTIEIEKKHLKMIFTYMIDGFEDFEGYIKSNYTQRSGFIPSYSDNVYDWFKYFFEMNEGDETHTLGSILTFILEYLDVCEDDLYMELAEDVNNCIHENLKEI